jgi:5'-nucleotidase
VLGETRAYSTEAITRAIRLIAAGARFIATNPDPTGPSPAGLQPATGAVAALISKATGVKPYFVGKPNPLMMREALRAIDAHSETTVMIGDRMDTDIVAGMEAGLQTILVLTGISTREEAQRFPFLPSRIVDSVADLVDDIGDEPRPAGWPPARRRILRQAAADPVGASAPNEQPPVRAANAS